MITDKEIEELVNGNLASAMSGDDCIADAKETLKAALLALRKSDVRNILNFEIENGDRVLYEKIETTVMEVITEGEWKGFYRIRISGNSSCVAEKNELILVHRKI